jgi:hypothetical protein
MPVAHQPITAARDAIDDVIRAAQECQQAGVWTRARAPGKWSPSQVAEHIARSIEASAHDIAGRPSNFPNLPWIVRPLARTLLFRRVLKNGGFPRAKTNAAMNPASGPESAEAAAARLEAAWNQFATECARAEARGTVTSCIFGSVPLRDYVRFQELHVRHHRRQMKGPDAQ